MFKNKTKRILLAVFACLLFASPASAEFFSDVILTGTNGIWVDSRSYASLQHAVTAVGAADREIVIIGAQGAVALTIPANVRLRFLRDGSINNTGQLIVNTRNIIAEDRQIFTGAGDIDFVDGSVVRSSWFSNFVEALDVTLDDTLTMVISETGRITSNSAVGNNVTLKWESPDNRIVAYGGRTLSNVKNIEAGNYQIFAGAGDIDFLDGTELYLSWFRRLRSVLTWVENEEVTIVVNEDSAVEYTQASTANENIKILPGGMLSPAVGVTLTLLNPLEAGPYQVFAGAGTLVYNSPTNPKLSWFSGLPSAITAIGAFETELIEDTDYVMVGDVTIPDTLSSRWTEGNTITTTGHTFTINGSFECGLYQVFAGTGTVTFGSGVREVYAEWWGIDGTADDVQIQLALNAVAGSSGIIRLLGKTYNLTSALSFTNTHHNITLEGAGRNHTILDGNAGAIYGLGIVGTDRLTIRNLRICDCATGGIAFSGGNSDNVFEDVQIEACGYGIYFNGVVVHNQFRRMFIYNCTNAGVHLSANGNPVSCAFWECRIELNAGGAYDASARGATHAHHMSFYKTIFESNCGSKAVNLSRNARSYSFKECHFENNCIGETTGYDIWMDAACQAITIEGCTFSYLSTDCNVAAYSIYVSGSTNNYVIRNNQFAPTRANYIAFRVATTNRDTSSVFENNAFYDDLQEYVSIHENAPWITYRGNGRMDWPDGWNVDGCFAKVETTDAAATLIWTCAYFEEEVAVYIAADIIGVATDGTERAAYTRKIFVYRLVAGAVTSEGTDDETTIESNAAWDCVLSASAGIGGSVQLNVTGEVGKTIKWRATVKAIGQKWN